MSKSICLIAIVALSGCGDNSNALARTIVFHSWDEVTEEEVYPDGTAEGWGCPTISNNNMRIVNPKLKVSEKPVLMWIYKD